MWNLLPLALPIVASQAFTTSMQLVDNLFVGHLGTEELAAAALATNVFKFMEHPTFGMLTALDTLLSQAFGAKQMRAYRDWMQTGLVVCAAARHSMDGAPQPRDAHSAPVPRRTGARRARRALLPRPRRRRPALHCLPGPDEAAASQGIVAPSVWIALVSTLANALADWLLIFHFGYGIDGAPLATSVSRWIQLLLMLVYLARRRATLASSLPSAHIACAPLWARLKTFLWFGLPGAAMLALEAWFFEAATFMAAYLGTVALDAHCIMLTVCAFTFLSGPFGVGIAASIRVGHLLGAGDGATARATAKATMALVLGMMLVIAVAKVAARWYLGALFTSDRHVIESVAAIAWIAAAFQVSDGLQAAIAGIMRGMGKQAAVVRINFLGFWLIGGSLGPALTFGARVGVGGLWWGMVVGLTLAMAIGGWVLLRADWHAEAAAAQARARAHPAGDGSGGGDGEGSGGRARRTKASKTAEIAPPSVSTPALDTASTVATLDGWTELNEAAVQAAAAGAAAAEVRSSGGGSHAVDDPPRRPQMEYV